MGRNEVPFIDTWWQSETGSCMASPRPHDPQFAPPGIFSSPTPHTNIKPGCATRAIPGVSVRVLNSDGSAVTPGEQGFAVVDKIGPSMARTIWGDPQRYLSSYWQHYGEHGWFLAGDGARLDDEGDLYILGRVDDVINVSGHRLSTIEIESALVTHPYVVEAGSAPVEDPLTGHAVLACVVLTSEGARIPTAQLREELRAHVALHIGPIAKPREVIAVPDLPKTRSGKITRRLLAQLYQGQPLGDRSSLQNEESLAAIEQVMASYNNK